MLNCTVRLLHGLKGVLDGSELKTFCVIMDNGILENVRFLSFSVKKTVQSGKTLYPAPRKNNMIVAIFVAMC